MSKVQLKNISKSYGENEILHDIDLEVNDSEFLVLVGPSGCGKSTTLRLISGLESPNDGEIFMDDILINPMDPSKRDIAMVFQNYALYPQMTVKENMAFGLKIRKFSKKEIDVRVIEAAEILKINDLLDRKPKELSGGQRQRVALGRAIVRKPKVFLFDEPLSNLDAKLRQEMRIEIKKLHQLLGTTMIYVTHDQTEAMTMGDRIVVMNNGKIEQIDSPQNTYLKPKSIFTSTFIGSPSINLFHGELKKKNSEWMFISDEISLYVEKNHYQYSKFKSSKVTFGIRAEDICDGGLTNLKDEKNVINAEVDFMENLGSEVNMHLNTKSNNFIVKCEKRVEVKQNTSRPMYFDVNQGHFFNLESGKIL